MRNQSDEVELIFDLNSSNKIQNVFQIGLETDLGITRNSSDSLLIEFQSETFVRQCKAHSTETQKRAKKPRQHKKELKLRLTMVGRRMGC